MWALGTTAKGGASFLPQEEGATLPTLCFFVFFFFATVIHKGDVPSRHCSCGYARIGPGFIVLLPGV